MASQKVSALNTIGSIDRATDLLYVVDSSAGTSNKATVNSVLGITGNPLGTTDTQSPTNKTFDNSNIFTVRDDRLTLQDNADTTKQAVFQLSGITTGTTRTYTMPNASVTLASLTGTETFTNKTLTSPVINTATIVNPTITTDAINEYTSANGVNIDGLLIKDALLPAGSIQPLNLVSGTGATWAWTSFVPNWTNLSVNNGTNIGFYTQIGKVVIVQIFFTFGGSSVMGTAPTITLPVTSTSNGLSSGISPIGKTGILDSGTAQFIGDVIWSTTTTAVMTVGGVGGTFLGPTGMTATVPMTWAVNDQLTAQFMYEAA